MRLETNRLILRPPQPSDADALAPIYADPAVMQYIGNGATRTREQMDAAVKWMIQQQEEHGFGLYIVEQKSNHHIIGRCGLICQTIDGQPEIELAYLLGSQSWGRGLATEAAMQFTTTPLAHWASSDSSHSSTRVMSHQNGWLRRRGWTMKKP